MHSKKKIPLKTIYHPSNQPMGFLDFMAFFGQQTEKKNSRGEHTERQRQRHASSVKVIQCTSMVTLANQ